MENSIVVPKKVQIEYHIVHQFHSRYTLKITESRILKKPSFTALFTIDKRWKWAKCPLMGKWIKNVLYECNTILFSLKKEGNCDTCCNMSECWVEMESRMAIPEAERGENYELLLNGYRISVLQDEKDSGDWLHNNAHVVNTI